MHKPSIPEALGRLGIHHQGRAFSCPNPAHPSGDRSPSAGFFGPGEAKFKCHSCGSSGDSIDLTMLAKGCSYREAVAFLGIAGHSSPHHTRQVTRQAVKPGGKKIHTITHRGKAFTFTATPDEPRENFPELRMGTTSELEALSSLRGIEVGALRLAQDWGVLRFGNHLKDDVCWFVTDATNRVAEARRLDGEVWSWSQKKQWARRGSDKSWPVGLKTNTPVDSCSIVLICEGGPDLLAGLNLLAIAGRVDIVPVTVLGASNQLGADAIEAISNRPVLIWAHSDSDDKGEKAALRWAEDLLAAGSPVEVVIPHEGGDVNDWLLTRPSRADVQARIPFGREGK